MGNVKAALAWRHSDSDHRKIRRRRDVIIFARGCAHAPHFASQRLCFPAAACASARCRLRSIARILPRRHGMAYQRHLGSDSAPAPSGIGGNIKHRA